MTVAIESRHASLDLSIRLWCQRHGVTYETGAGIASRGYGASLYFFVAPEAAAEIEREFGQRLAYSRATTEDQLRMISMGLVR